MKRYDYIIKHGKDLEDITIVKNKNEAIKYAKQVIKDLNPLSTIVKYDNYNDECDYSTYIEMKVKK